MYFVLKFSQILPTFLPTQFHVLSRETSKQNKSPKLCMVTHSFSPRIWQADAGRSLRLRPALCTSQVPGTRRENVIVQGRGN